VLLAAVLSFLATGVAHGAEPASSVPSFLIETVRVEGTRHASPEIVVSESRLREGESYTEAELLEAVYRIRRLPFVLDATFALERGSRRGRFGLVVTVVEVRRLFYGFDGTATRFGRELALESTFPEDVSTRYSLLLGARFFVGKYGVLVAAADSEDRGVQVGYTRYHLFGRQAFLSIGYLRDACCPVTVLPLGLDPTFSSWESTRDSDRLTLTLGIPLGDDRSLQLEASHLTSREGRRRAVLEPGVPTLFLHRDYTERQLRLAWLDDTRDDPTFPTRGQLRTAALEYRRVDADFFDRLTFDPETGDFVNGLPEVVDAGSRLLRASFSHSLHRPLGARHTVSASLRLAAGRAEIENLPGGDRLLPTTDLDVFEATASFRHGMELWKSRGRGGRRELFWETVLDLGYEVTSPRLDLPQNPLRRIGLSSSLTWRTPRGIVRVGIAFVDVGSSR
jgi:hypothetical protein